MLWNWSDNDKEKNNPWGDNNDYSNKKKGEYDQGPPDLDDVFRKVLMVFGSLKKSSSNNHMKMKGSIRGKLVIALIMIAIIWAMSGLYTIREAERGVVTRFGQFSHLVEPGLNWKPNFIDQVRTVNVETVQELATSGVMLTSDENVINVEMNVQYRITNPKNYLYSVTDPDDSLRQATDSALRGVIGQFTMDRILTEGRTVIRNETKRELDRTILPYSMGITLLDANFQAARPPEQVKASFDDAISARENREQYVREAEAYANEVQPQANGKARRILEEAKAYKERIVLEAQGEAERFNSILPQYRASPEVTKKRLYIESMERILAKTQKVLVNNNSNSLIISPSSQLPENQLKDLQTRALIRDNLARQQDSSSWDGSRSDGDIMDQRRFNAMRNDIQNKGGN
jgi:membrane protease subunit HflK